METMKVGVVDIHPVFRSGKQWDVITACFDQGEKPVRYSWLSQPGTHQIGKQVEVEFIDVFCSRVAPVR